MFFAKLRSRPRCRLTEGRRGNRYKLVDLRVSKALRRARAFIGDLGLFRGKYS